MGSIAFVITLFIVSKVIICLGIASGMCYEPNYIKYFGVLLQNSPLSPTIHPYIPVYEEIKDAAKVNNLVIPQYAGWITSYPPIVNGNVMQT